MVKRHHPAKPICGYSPKAAALGLNTFGVARTQGFVSGRSLGASPRARRDATVVEIVLFWVGTALCMGLSWWVLV
jgi:hypothetical protein